MSHWLPRLFSGLPGTCRSVTYRRCKLPEISKIRLPLPRILTIVDPRIDCPNAALPSIPHVSICRPFADAYLTTQFARIFAEAIPHQSIFNFFSEARLRCNLRTLLTSYLTNQ